MGELPLLNISRRYQGCKCSPERKIDRDFFTAAVQAQLDLVQAGCTAYNAMGSETTGQY
jgi:hypothetical protein